MAFDFGAALSSAGNITPAYQKAQSNIKDEKELAAERVRKAQEFSLNQRAKTAQTVATEQRNKEWVPMRSYESNGEKHTVYFTPEGLKDIMDESDPITERQQMLDKLSKSDPDFVKGLSPEQLAQWKLTGQITTATRPGSTKPPALDWVDEADGKGNWFKVGYTKDTHQRAAALPETKVGFGVTPMETTTWNPMVGEWVQSYRMPSPQPSFDGAEGGTPPSGMPPGARPSAPPPGSSPRMPPASTAATMHQLSQPPRQAGSNEPPKVFRFEPQNPTIRGLGDSVASVMQQFVGSGNEPLWSYADLFDNPKTRQAINDALTISMNPTPTMSEHPGFGESIAGASGLLQLNQTMMNKRIRDARENVEKVGGPRALEFVDRLAELKGSVPALRAFSRTSAAQGAIAPLFQESPVLNTMNSRDFRLRSALILRTLGGALQGDPAINPQYSQWILQQASDAMKGQSSSAKGPKTAEEYLQGNK